MQTANALLSLGGDHGNTVMKWAITAAEIAVLREIHGDESVRDVEPVGHVKRTHRQERERLAAIYGGAKRDDKRIVEMLFPGVAARVFEDISELDLPEEFFKATTRLNAESIARPVTSEADDPAENVTGEQASEADDADAGVGEDMNDGHDGNNSIMG